MTQPATSRSLDIVAIGEPMIEFNQTRPGEPNFLQGYGGDTSNLTIAAARAGARTAYVTRVGDDSFGRLFLDLWRSEGVETSGVSTDKAAHTAVYFVTHGPDGHDFSYLRAGSAASRMQPSDLPQSMLASARFVHASGISMAISASAADTVLAAFGAAREAGVQVSFDPNLRLKLWPLARARALIGATVGLADFFFPSIDDARVLSGLDDADAIVDWSHRLGARVVVLKLGADGALWSDGTRRTRLPACKVKVADTTGAGDCFCGSALARLAAGDTIGDAVRYANAAAALKSTGFGAVAPLPRRDAVLRLLAQADSA